MPKQYKNTGPLPICGKKPGDIVDAVEVPDVALLTSLGWLVPVESGTSSSTMKASKSSTEEKS